MFVSAVFLLLASSSPVFGQFECFQHGECVESIFIDFDFVTSVPDCLQYCKEHHNCEYFTFTPGSEASTCTAFLNCVSISNETCFDCVSGSKDCEFDDGLTCYEPGRCLGTLIDIDYYSSYPDNCMESCHSLPGCEWWSYNEYDGDCVFTKDCDVVDINCEGCHYGQKNCGGITGPCGGTLDASVPGTITSPGYPRSYGSHIGCDWTFTASEGSIVMVDFKDIDIGISEYDNCDEDDGIFVHDGPTNSSELIKMICHSDGPTEVVKSTGNQMFIRFLVSYAGSNRGFLADYSEV